MPETEPEHLDRLTEGVAAWNAWRAGHPYIRPQFKCADLSGRDLAEANLQLSVLVYANFRQATLTRALAYHSDLFGAHFEGATCRGLQCSYSRLNSAHFQGADFTGAALAGCDLGQADLADVVLREADLSGANLSRCSIQGADLSGARLGGTVFGAVDFRGFRGLESAVHIGPSTIGVDSLILSNGIIPDTFLRAAGASDSTIEYALSLSMRAPQFPSCFLSHSTEDREFADKLYRDLDARRVPCWYSEEHMRTGDRIRQRLHDVIGAHDKLLVILSAASIPSTWVESEVETALELERRTRKTVLFPIRIDNTAMEATAAWVVELRRRHIADFTRWREDAEYDRALTRLMDDLRAAASPA